MSLNNLPVLLSNTFSLSRLLMAETTFRMMMSLRTPFVRPPAPRTLPPALAASSCRMFFAAAIRANFSALSDALAILLSSTMHTYTAHSTNARQPKDEVRSLTGTTTLANSGQCPSSLTTMSSIQVPTTFIVTQNTFLFSRNKPADNTLSRQ